MNLPRWLAIRITVLNITFCSIGTGVILLGYYNMITSGMVSLVVYFIVFPCWIGLAIVMGIKYRNELRVWNRIERTCQTRDWSDLQH